MKTCYVRICDNASAPKDTIHADGGLVCYTCDIEWVVGLNGDDPSNMRPMSTATIQKGEFLSVMILEASKPTLWGHHLEQGCYGLRLEVSKVSRALRVD